MPFSELLNYFVSLIVICSPLSAIPAFLLLTSGKSIDEKKRTAFIATLAVAVILIVVTWIGAFLLEAFGIKVPAFQTAGGIILLLVSLAMLNSQPSRMQQTDEESASAMKKDSVAVVPLAMPIIAGPAAISTVIIGVSSNPGCLNQLYMTICAILVASFIGSVLYFATKVEGFLGQTGINIVNRIGGLILTAMAVQSIATGIHGLILLYTV